MKFYHFTAIEYIEPILSSALWKGEVVIDDCTVLNGVNLTTDPDPHGHGLSDGRRATRRERRLLKRLDGIRVSKEAYFPDKRRVRMEINLPDNAPTLVNWLSWSAMNVEPRTRQRLIQTGGGIIKASTWWVSFAPISPSAVRVVGIRGHDGSYTDCKSMSEIHQAIMALNLPGIQLIPAADA